MNINVQDYVYKANEDGITTSLEENYSTLDLIKILTEIKSNFSILASNLQKRSKIFIFGAGGTTSWFLPKLLKIYNDAFNKLPESRYNLEIILIDKDIV